MSNYNPMINNISYHYKYIGRKDNGETRKVRSVLPRRSLVHGPFIPIAFIINAFGIEEMLKKQKDILEAFDKISWW